MLDFLIEHGLDLSKTALIGHSLGAHVVGLAARYAKNDVDYIVGRFLSRKGQSVDTSTGHSIIRRESEHFRTGPGSSGLQPRRSRIQGIQRRRQVRGDHPHERWPARLHGGDR